MRDPATDRVDLEVLEDRGVRRLLARERDVEDGVAAVWAGQHRSELTLRHGDGMRLLATAVDDPGNEAVAAEPSGRGRADGLALLRLQLDSFSGHAGLW